jgi:hypothetical protein
MVVVAAVGEGGLTSSVAFTMMFGITVPVVVYSEIVVL